MILGSTLSEARLKRKRSTVNFFEGFRTDLIASNAEQNPSPQAFLVEQDPSFKLATHFHLVHQFQVVAEGTGTLGRHQLIPWTVHYSSPESGYGPITAGPQGLSYYTIRLISDIGAWKLPDQRKSMRTGLSKQQRTEPSGNSMAETKRTVIHDTSITDIIPLDSYGLAAWSMRIPPSAAAALPDPMTGAGRFCIVRGGEVSANHSCYDRMSVIFISKDEHDFKLEAGQAGAELIVVQFPKEALCS